MLVTLGFPLKPSGHRVQLTDIGSSAPSARPAPVTSWTVGRFNENGVEAAQVLEAWRAPLADGSQRVLNGAQVCKLALHNRRCLLLQVQQHLPLWAASWQSFGRLGNWAFTDAHQVAEVPGTPPAVCYDTLTAAVAATVGLQIGGHVRCGAQCGWLILPGGEGCRYTPAQVVALAGNAEYLRANDDTLALASAVLRNRSALLRRSEAAGALNIFHHHSRYAVISAAADEHTQMLAAQHLNL